MAHSIQELILQLGDFRRRHDARSALAQHGADAAPLLLEALSNRNNPTNMRWAAVTLLAACRYTDACPVLIEIMREDLNLRGEAWRALETITERTDVGDDPDGWERALDVADVPAEEETPEPEEDASETEVFQLVRRSLAAHATKISWEEEGYAYVRLALPGGRKQQILISFDQTDADDNPLACIYTECGPDTPNAEQAIYRRNVTLQYGKFTVEKDADGVGKIVVRHLAPLAGLTAEILREVVFVIAREADNLEYELTQSDRI